MEVIPIVIHYTYMFDIVKIHFKFLFYQRSSSPHSTSTHLLVQRPLRFRTRSRIFSSMRLRFQKTMIPPLSRTLPILQCFSLLGTSMPLLPCPNLAEGVAVPPLNLAVGKTILHCRLPFPPVNYNDCIGDCRLCVFPLVPISFPPLQRWRAGWTHHKNNVWEM